jgi:hypothetical protein
LLKLKEMEVDMQGAEPDEPEMSFRRGYQQGAIELFYAIERFLDPATREVVRAWIEKDVYIWSGEGDARSSAELAVKHVSWSKVVCTVAAGGDGGRRPPDLPAQSVDAVSASDCRTTPL